MIQHNNSHNPHSFYNLVCIFYLPKEAKEAWP